MATVKEVYQFIDQIAPFDTQEGFDNAGFLVGRGDRDVTKLLVALDITAEVAEEAARKGCTRAAVCMDRAAGLSGELVIAVGNAPTALIRLFELIQEGSIRPVLIIGAPVGFVNVVEAKELIMTAGVPYIVPKGRKGGSNIAAAVCNAMLYQK